MSLRQATSRENRAPDNLVSNLRGEVGEIVTIVGSDAIAS